MRSKQLLIKCFQQRVKYLRRIRCTFKPIAQIGPQACLGLPPPYNDVNARARGRDRVAGMRRIGRAAVRVRRLRTLPASSPCPLSSPP